MCRRRKLSSARGRDFDHAPGRRDGHVHPPSLPDRWAGERLTRRTARAGVRLGREQGRQRVLHGDDLFRSPARLPRRRRRRSDGRARKSRLGGETSTPNLSRTSYAVAFCALLFSSHLPAQQTESAEARVNAQRDELARIRAERDELEKKMSGLQNTAHEIRDEVNLLDKQHDATARMVKSLDQQLVAITDEVQTTTSDLQKSEREAGMKRTVLQRRLIEIYKRGPLYSAEVLFSAQPVGQPVARYKYLHLLALRDKGLVHRLDELHDKIESQQVQLVRLQNSVAENRSQKEREAARLADLEKEQAKNLVRVQGDTKRTKARLAELEKSEARLNNLIASFEAERRRASGRGGTVALSPSSIRTTDIGRLDWPVNGTFLYRFGRFVNPNNTTTRWNGIGIGAPARSSTL